MSTTNLDALSLAKKYVLYSDDVEVIEPDEQETIDKIIQAMTKGGELTREKYGKSVRTSHAKAHGLSRGRFSVLESLPDYLRQGLFAQAKEYEVIARLSHVPGDLDDDRKVSGPRGFSFKVLGVEGPKLPVHKGETTQDFVLDTGKVFTRSEPRHFWRKSDSSSALRREYRSQSKAPFPLCLARPNEALNALGANSSALDFFGHPFLHPLGEAYFSQVPIRYGDYIAKLSLTPVSPGLKALKDEKLELEDYDGLRAVVTEFFRSHSAEFEISIQLCTDLERMPVENANKEWPEDESPYQPVARLTFPVQDAYSVARQSYADDGLSFCPAHSLAAHRPLGSIMRARLQAYEVLGRARREQNGDAPSEPLSMERIPE